MVFQYSKDPRITIAKSFDTAIEFKFTVAKDTLSYVNERTNALVTAECDKSWNAYKTFRRQEANGDLTRISPKGFKGSSNW